MVTQAVLECPGGWTNQCGCLREHNYCWPRPDTRCCDRLQYTDETPPDEIALIERMLRMSVELLHGMSGRQFGLCPRVVRPCRDECGQRARPVYGYTSGGGLLEPLLDGGKWYNAVCGKCVTDCSCSNVCQVTLPRLTQSVIKVMLDGVVLDPESYRVDNHGKLVRVPVTIAPATDVPFHVAANMNDAGTVFCFPVAPSTVVNLFPTVAPTPPFCYGSPAMLGMQQADIPAGDCLLFTVDVGGTDAGQPVTMTGGSGFGVFVFPASTVLGAGDVATSAWKNNVRLKIRYVAGAGLVVDENGQAPMPGGSSTIEMCFERRTFGGSVDCWPTCQDMGLPPSELGTFEVSILRGTPVPEYGLWAAGLFACELIKACAPSTDDCGCKLPANVQSVVREGVSLSLEDFVIGGGATGTGTGVPEVDLWLKMVNPNNTQTRSRAYSVDKRPPRRTTWPCADD